MLALLAALVLFSGAPRFAGEPFVDLGFEPALAKAQEQKKLLLLDFTASWCPPCHKMEKETWAAAEVRAWLGEHALAIQVDVDLEPELAKRFKIEAMPTVVALREGAEFDRIVGYRDAAGFLAWGRDVRAGKRAGDALLVRARELRESTDAQARYRLAQELARAEHNDEALFHYLWLWPATRPAPSFGGVRVSFMLRDMAQLARKHAPAKAAFDEILAGLQAQIELAEVPAFETWQEWTAFCKYFSQNERIVAWYEKRRDAEGRLLAAAEGFFPELIVAEVFDVLIQSGRPLDAVRLYDDAVQRAEKIVESYRRSLEHNESLEPELRQQVEGFGREKLIADLGKIHAALLLGDRADEAARVAAKLLETLDTSEARLGLVREGVALLSRPDPNFVRWLDEAEAAGGNVRLLRRKLDKLDRAEAPAEVPGGGEEGE